MNEFVTLAKTFFLSYCHIINANFISAEHHHRISKVLDEIAAGKTRRLIVSMPPRHGKTFMISQHFPTYFMGRNPKKNIISTAYNQSLAEDYGIFVKNIMLSKDYQDIFKVSLDISSKSKKRFSLNKGGNYYAVGKGGPITGRGGHLILIDDLVKNEQEARSPLHRKNVIDWYKNTLRTRLMPRGSIIVVQTRWHEEDLIGYLLKNSGEDWIHINLPAISAEGDALWPEFYDIAALETIKKEIGSLVFQGLYQGEPCIDDGKFIKADWIKRYNMKTGLPVAFDGHIMTMDLTFKGGAENDYVCAQVWGNVQADYYLKDMIRGQWDFTQTLFHVKQFLMKHPEIKNILIEDAANGAAVHSVLKKQIPGVRLWKPRTSKEGRLMAVSPLYEAGNVYIPDEPKYDIFVSEHLGFPNASHDDTVDTATMALLNLKNGSKRILMSMGDSIY